MDKQCEVCGRTNVVCMNRKIDMMLCAKHYTQMRIYGYFLDSSPIGKYDKNEIIIENNIAKIITLNKRYEKNGEYIIDLEDVDLVKNIKWRPDGKGYAHNNNKSNPNGTIYLHRLVLNVFDKALYVDHIDKNKNNNMKSNLRIVSHQQNNINSSLRSDNKSGISGVSLYSLKDGSTSWRSRIMIDNNEIGNSYFQDFRSAVSHRLYLESLYFKEFSPNYNHETNTIIYESGRDNDYFLIEYDLNGNMIRN